MTLLLFFKQIIDIFYECKIADYLLVAVILIVIANQIWMQRPDGEKLHIMESIYIPDICIFIISAILIVHLLINPASDIFVYGKIFSGILLYITGRLCRKRVTECTWAIVIASYIVVYANLIARFVMFGWDNFFTVKDSKGLLYFFDTDLAYAILLALIFIAMYAQNRVIKFLTIFVVCPFLIMGSDADIQKVLMFVIYIILFLFMAERAVKKRKFTDFILPVVILGLLIIIGGLILPVFTGHGNQHFMSALDNIISTDNFSKRYEAWNEQISDIARSPAINQIFGSGITGNGEASNQYIEVLKSAGMTGMIALLLFVICISVYAARIEDRKTYYVTVMLAITFLGTCIVVNGMEFTQLSWFPMLYAGMATCGRQKREVLESE